MFQAHLRFSIPHLWNQPLLFSMVLYNGEWCLETEIWALYAPIVTEVTLLLVLFIRQSEEWHTCAPTCDACICIFLYLLHCGFTRWKQGEKYNRMFYLISATLMLAQNWVVGFFFKYIKNLECNSCKFPFHPSTSWVWLLYLPQAFIQ